MTSAVVVCSWGDETSVSEGTQEVLTLGRRVASGLGVDLDWLIVGPAPADAADVGSRYAVAHIDLASSIPAEFSPDTYVAALADYAKQATPSAMLFLQTYEARLVAPRLAARLGSAVVMNAVDANVDGESITVEATAYGGDTRVVYRCGEARPSVIGVTAGAIDPAPSTGGAAPEVRQVTLDIAATEERIKVIEPARAEGPRLEDAQRIVAGGRGLGSGENYRLVEELAAALQAMPAASRAIVDDGWVDASRQIGLTGKVVKPELYVAAGISGASQHMAGCSAAKVIVAINRDPDASIFRYARYGIVGDCAELLPAITKAAAQR